MSNNGIASKLLNKQKPKGAKAYFDIIIGNIINASPYVNLNKWESITILDYIYGIVNNSKDQEYLPFSEKLISKCKCIIKSLDQSPDIFPTGRGSIQFQFELEDRSYLELEIFEDKINALIVPKRIYTAATEKQFTSGDNDIKKAKEIVDDFYRGRSSRT